MPLRASLLGPVQLFYMGEELRPSSRKALCLIVVLALRGRPVLREELAELLWGPGKLRNLRQALYQLKALPGAEEWLEVGDQHVRLLAETDVQELIAGKDVPIRGTLCAELRGTTLAVDDLIGAHSTQVQAALEQRAEGPLRERLAQLIGLSSAPMSVLAGVLDCGPGRVQDLLAEGLPSSPELPRLQQDALRCQIARVWQRSDLQQAAALFIEAGDPDQGALALEQAGELGRAASAARDPALKLRLALSWEGSSGAARSNQAEEAVVFLEGLGTRTQDPEIVGFGALARVRQQLRAGELEDGLFAAQDALETAQGHGLEVLVVRAHILLGQGLLLAGRLEEARPHFEGVLSRGGPAEHRLAHMGLGALHGMSGDLEGSVAHHRQALRLAREAKAFDVAARALNNLGGDLHRLGQYALSAKRFGEAAQLAEQVGLPLLGALCLSNRVESLLSGGQLGEARVGAKLAMDAAVAVGNARVVGLALDMRAELERVCGRWEESAGWSERACKAHRDAGNSRRELISKLNQHCALVEGGKGEEGSREVLRAQDALDAALDAGEQATAILGALELALWARDPALAEEILDRVPWQEAPSRRSRELGALVSLHYGLSAERQVVEGLARRRCPDQALACAVLHAVDPKMGWDQAQEEALEVLGAGLLAAQREALAERVQRLLG